jgi:hypothetical protein
MDASPGCTNLMFFPADILDPSIMVLTARVTFDALEFVFISISALPSVNSCSRMFETFESRSSTALCIACLTCRLASSFILYVNIP